jgi:formiminotetrahydrofolate cyclodeaminase
MATTMDTGYLAASYSIPEPRLVELLDAPTADLVREFLQKAEEKAHTNDKLQAQKLRSDVELESAQRNINIRAKQIQDSTTKHRKEIEELKQQLTEERKFISDSIPRQH